MRAQPGAPDDARRGADVLEAWDNQVAAGSRGAVLFQRFWDSYAAAVRPPYATPWNEANPATTPFGLADAAAAVEHLARAVRSTRETYGEDVAWGTFPASRGVVRLPERERGDVLEVRVRRSTSRGKAMAAGNSGGPTVRDSASMVLLVDFSRPVMGWRCWLGQTTNLARA